MRALAQGFSEQSGLAITFDAPSEIPSVSSDAALALFRAVQEALSNVVRHSGATSARVSLVVVGDQLTLIVHDNGRGLPSPTTQHPSPRHMGLMGMTERIVALHGSVNIETHDGATITVRVPLTNGR